MNKNLSRWVVENHSNVLKADLLKVPHHGTEGVAVNEFFETVGAKASLVPAPAELWCSERSERIRNVLEKIGSKIYVNGFHGNVWVFFSKDGYRVESRKSLEASCGS